jgi:hypothetical protein
MNDKSFDRHTQIREDFGNGHDSNSISPTAFASGLSPFAAKITNAFGRSAV